MLNHYDLAGLIKKYNLNVFIETGVGNGDGVIEAQKHSFEKIISIEIMPLQVQRMREKFKDDSRVEIIEGDTLNQLPFILASLKNDNNVCFFLDAHYPGADIGMGRHDADVSEDLRLPIEKEMKIINIMRPAGKDVVLFDDIKIYRFQGRDCWRGDIKPRQQFSSDEFYKDIFAETHDFSSSEEDTGYGQLTPKL